MSYTSSPNGLFTYTITGVSDSTELAVIQSAFNKWDSICLIDTSRWGSSYSIIVSYSIASLATGILGGASLQTYNISQGTTYGNIMPYEGTIQLNSLYTASMLSDTRTGGKTKYYYVVLHELGHILGIGPFWSSSDPIYAPITSYTDANDSTTKYYYTGTNAFKQYKSYLSSDLSNAVIGLPIEDNGGSGTAEVHPEEGLENEVSSDTRYINGIFHPGINEELMTGWMEGSPTDTPLSRVTLGFLEDMGYIVNYSDAESFSIIYTSMSFSDYRKQNKTISEMKSLGYTDTQILQDGYFNIIDLSLAGYTANQIMSAKISAGNFDTSWNSIVPTDLSYTGMSGGQPGMLYYSPVGRKCYGNRLNFVGEYQGNEPSSSAPYNEWSYGEYDPNTHNTWGQNVTRDTSTTMEPLTPGAHFIIDPSGNLNIGIHGEAYYSSGAASFYPYDAWFNTIDTSNGNYISNASAGRGLMYQYNRQNGIIYNGAVGGDLPGDGGDGGVSAAGGNGRLGSMQGFLGNGSYKLGQIGTNSTRNSGKGPDGDQNHYVSTIQFVNGGKEWVIDNSHNSYFCRNGIYFTNSGATGTQIITSNYTSQVSSLWQADPDHNSGLNMGPYHYNKNAQAKGFHMLIENSKFTINGVSQDTIRADVGHAISFLFTDWDKTGYTFSISSTNDGTHGGGSELSTSDGLTAISTSQPSSNYYISNDHNQHRRIFTPTTAGTYYYYCPEVAGYGGTIIIDASGTSQDGYYNYHNSAGVGPLTRGTGDRNNTKCIHGTQGMIVRKHGSYGTDQGKVLWYTCWNNEDGVNKLNTISISDVTRAYHNRNPTINWTLDIDITTTFTEISNHFGAYIYDSFFDSSDNLILGGSVMTSTQTNSQYTYYSLLMRVAVDDVSGSLRAYKLQQIPNLIEEDSTSSHRHGWSTGVRTMFDKNHNYLVATPYNVDASYGVSVYKFDSSFNLDTTYGVDGSFNSIYTPYYKQNTNTGNNFMFGSNGYESTWSRDNNNQIVGATAYDSTDDSLYIIGAGDHPSTSSAEHNFVSIIKLDNTGNYDASFSSIYGAAGQLDIVDVIEKKTGASGTTHDGYTTYFGSSARNSILCPTAAIIRENALFIACSTHTAPYNGIYILKLKLSNTPDVRDLSNINFTLSDFQSSGYTDLSELKKIPYPLTDYKTVGYSVENMLSAFSVQETLSAGFSSQEILDSQMESFLQEDFATFDAANKFKETYMKTFLDVSGDIRLDSNYTAIFTALSADVSSNIIRNELKANNLINLQDLSINQHLFVQNDISLNKKMFIAGDLSVNGTLQFPDNSLSESDFTDVFESASGSNQFNNNNSQITTALDISGLEFYVAGDVTAVDKDFQVEGNTYANNFINDELDNVIMEDDSLINRLDLSNNAFSVSKIYYDSSYSNIADDFSYNAVPFISDNGKNICYPTYDINGTTNYYNTLYSNNHGTSFIDMATRLGGTAGSTNTKGLLNFYVTENQKYIYGYHNSEGIKRSDNYGYSFTDISMVKVPNSDLSYCVGLSSTNSAFDTTHSNLIASSASGKHVYMGGLKPYVENGPHKETGDVVPTHGWDFRQALSSGSTVTDQFSQETLTLDGPSATVADGASVTQLEDHIDFGDTTITISPTFTMEMYWKSGSTRVLSGSNNFCYLWRLQKPEYSASHAFTVRQDSGGNYYITYPRDETANNVTSQIHDVAHNWTANTTYHFVITFTPTTSRMYVNNVLLSTATLSTQFNNGVTANHGGTTSALMNKASASWSTLNGDIYYWRFYDSELSASEIDTLYNSRTTHTTNINWDSALDYGHFLIKSSDFGQTMNFDLSASAINMVTHQNSDLSFNSMIGSRHVSCSADGKYVICSVHGFTPLDDLNIVSATNSSANWYPVLSRDYGTNWDLLDSKTFKDYHLLDNTDLSLNTSNSLNNCVGTAISKTGKYVACAFNSAASIPKPIMFYLSSDYGKTFDLKANLELDTEVVNPNYNWDFRVASSTSINDTIQGVEATYVGTTSTVENGLAYTGTTGHATLPTGINNGTGENSVEFYIKYTAAFTSWDTIFSVYTNSNCLLYLSQYGTNGNLIVINGDAGNPGTTQPQVTNISATAHLNEWLHIVATYEHTSGDTTCTGRFYANGSLVSTHTGLRKVNDTSTSASTSTGYIGSPVSDSQYNNTGYIRYFRLYNRMLSDTEVTALYNNRDNLAVNTYNTYNISHNIPPTYNWDFRVAATTSITDSIGGLTATYANNATSTIANGISLTGGTTDGNGHHVDLQDFEIGLNYSFEVYLKFGSSVDNFERVLDFGDGQQSNNIIICRDGTTSNLQFANFTGSTLDANISGVGTIVSGVLTHLVGVIGSDGYLKFYQDGTLLGTSTTTAGTSTKTRTHHYIGRSTWSGRSDIDGNIYYLRVYNRALTQNDVTALYNNRVATTITKVVNSNLSNGLQISLSSNAETISLVPTKSATEVYYSSDYGTTWNTKSITLSNDQKEHYSQISSNSQYLIRNITSESNNYYHSKLCKQITPYEKTYYTHMVKDFSNISNGNSSADSSITYSGGILTASDYRLKSNVQQLQDETVDNLQPVKFTFKNSQHETFGLIAHELEENYPFLVDGEKDGSHYQTVNYNGLLGVLVHELQLIRKGLEEYE